MVVMNRPNKMKRMNFGKTTGVRCDIGDSDSWMVALLAIQPSLCQFQILNGPLYE
jgi:hypothetical protein